jgi:hypothetical protein
MKAKVFFSVLFVAVLSVVSVKAGDSKSEVNSDEAVRSEVSKVLSKSFLTEGSVTVNFAVDSYNKVSVLKVVGTDSDLVKEVKSKLNNYTLTSGSGNYSGKYAVTLKFVDAFSADSRLLANK